MVVELAEVISEMHCEVNQEISGSYPPLSYRRWIYSGKLCGVDPGYRVVELSDRRADLRAEICACHASRREFRIPIAYILSAGEHRCNEVTKISGDVQDERPARIRDSRRGLPDRRVVRIRSYLTLDRAQITQDNYVQRIAEYRQILSQTASIFGC